MARLPAQTERGDDLAVALGVGTVQVLEHATALADHLQQAAARVVVVLVLGQMAGQILNAPGQQSNLHLRRAGVSFVLLVLADDVRLFVGLQCHACEPRSRPYSLTSHASGGAGLLLCW